MFSFLNICLYTSCLCSCLCDRWCHTQRVAMHTSLSALICPAPHMAGAPTPLAWMRRLTPGGAGGLGGFARVTRPLNAGRWDRKLGFLPLRVALCAHLQLPAPSEFKASLVFGEGGQEQSVCFLFSFLPHVLLTPGSRPLGHLYPCLLPSS